MVDSQRVVRELQTYLEDLRREHEMLSVKIKGAEHLLAELGEAVRRGPGRPKGSGAKRGPGRPPKVAMLAASASVGPDAKRRGPGRPKGAGRGPGRPKGSGNKAPAGGRKPMSQAAREAARERMMKYWAQRKKTASAG